MLRPLCEYDVKELRDLARRYGIPQTTLVPRYRPGNPKRFRSRTKRGLYQALQARMGR